MALNVSALLDKAKVVHRLPSDYKLALVMGVKQTTLANYRQGKTLPDARVIRLICELTGDDPALLAAEIEAERATTEDARALWRGVVQRLQSTLHTAIFALLTAGVLWGGLPSDAQAKTAGFSSSTPYTLWNIKGAAAKAQKRPPCTRQSRADQGRRFKGLFRSLGLTAADAAKVLWVFRGNVTGHSGAS